MQLTKNFLNFVYQSLNMKLNTMVPQGSRFEFVECFDTRRKNYFTFLVFRKKLTFPSLRLWERRRHKILVAMLCQNRNKRKDADPAAEKTKASVIVDEEILGLKRSLDFQNLSDMCLNKIKINQHKY